MNPAEEVQEIGKNLQVKEIVFHYTCKRRVIIAIGTFKNPNKVQCDFSGGI